ncbi:DUF3024 domain-containing protein [Variovorax ginsengisoli]|uniref:DUF3024 domain-containing protein n=1 Tax=Variovorax ginsengisoli TaxID=363844 RepID=A0ABT9SG50_9BURK|nr:hypothetical protein [Variovorax ginsengisoli]MDP9902776.1 hypothetical protein [Variovorax ginsengisoli]
MSTAVAAAAGPVVVDLMQCRLERALRERTRYRYVRPRVLREGDAFRIESPCCSRNVDPEGGVINIALLAPGAPRLSRSQPGRTVQSWRLFARDHVTGTWVAQDESDEVGELMDVLCVDAQRIFWP